MFSKKCLEAALLVYLRKLILYTDVYGLGNFELTIIGAFVSVVSVETAVRFGSDWVSAAVAFGVFCICHAAHV